MPGAIAAWQRVVALAPDDWQAHNDLGAALIEQPRTGWAPRQRSRPRSEAAPDEPTVLVNRATLDVRRGRADAAVAALEDCLGAVIMRNQPWSSER